MKSLRTAAVLLTLLVLLAGCYPAAPGEPVHVVLDNATASQTGGTGDNLGPLGAATYNTLCYRPQGGASFACDSGGAFDVNDGAELNVNSGATLTIEAGATVNGLASSTSGESITFEGATADAYETVLAVVDPTADVTATLPAETGAIMMSSLLTNGTTITNSVTGASNALVWEGATADAYETSLAATDPTADRTVTLPDAAGTVMLSSLATNGADAANAVTGASNGLLFEGSSADGNETTLTLTNPTADRTITLPNVSGTVMLTNTPGAIVLGTSTVTDTLVISHGLTTPQTAFCTLLNDPESNGAHCSATISSATVTLKLWKADGVTAGSVGKLVSWMVGGQP